MSYRAIVLSQHPFARGLRKFYWGIRTFTLPFPPVTARPVLALYLFCRGIYYFGVRVFVCEPLFKAYCKTVGRGVRTGVFIHWIQGKGDIIIGNDVLIDGKCSISFAARYCASPTLQIGDSTGIGHNCNIAVGKRITIGSHCRISTGVLMFDSGGHPTDPEMRKAGLPAASEDVRPITIQDNVWIGRNAIVFPGVTIGEGSVVAAGAVVITDVPSYTLVAGNPARKISSLQAAPSEHQPAAPITERAPA